MDADIQQRVFKIIDEIINRNENEIQLDASLRDDLEFDSLQQMTLFIALEDEFLRTIPPEQVTEINTVKEVIDFIDKKLQEEPSTV